MKKLIEKLDEIKNQLAEYEAEFEAYGLRFHRGQVPGIGEYTNNSFRWDDGEITDEELDGTCALDVRFASSEGLLKMIDDYAYGDGEIIIIASNHYDGGEDLGEIVLSDAIRVA